MRHRGLVDLHPHTTTASDGGARRPAGRAAAGVEVPAGCELTADLGGSRRRQRPVAGALRPGADRRRVVTEVAEAFDRYLSAGRPAYVPAPSVPLGDAVALAGKAGGVAVLAYPGRLHPEARDRVLQEALAAGADGIEVWHSQHDPELRRPLADLAARQGLLATGGSDYHGHHKPNVHLGTLAVPSEVLDALREQLATQGPLCVCVGSTQNEAKQPKGGNT